MAQLSENHYYTLVEPTELQRVCPIYLPNGQPDEKAVLEASRQMGIDAIFIGRVVNYKVEVGDTITPYMKGETNKSIGASFGGSGALSRPETVSQGYLGRAGVQAH